WLSDGFPMTGAELGRLSDLRLVQVALGPRAASRNPFVTFAEACRRNCAASGWTIRSLLRCLTPLEPVFWNQRLSENFPGIFARCLRNKDLFVKYFSVNNLGGFPDWLHPLPPNGTGCHGVRNVTACFEMFSMWSILWNGFHICKSFKSCWIKSCYTPPTKPRSALSEIVPLWCATPCGNISAGWNCEPAKSATARATRDSPKPTRKRGVGNRRPRGRKNSRRKNSPRPDTPRRGSALPVCRARQKTTRSRAHPQQRHRLFIHGHGCACHFHDSRSAIGGRSE